MKFGMAGVSVFLAMPTHRDIPAQTAISLLETQQALHEKNIPFRVHMEVGGSLVHHSRTSLVHQFLKTDHNRMFWVDSDITWKPDDFLRFLALSTKMEVVCGAYLTKTTPSIFFLNYEQGVLEANEYGCLSVKGAGLGFTVVQRKVIEELYAKAPLRKYPWSEDLIPKVFRMDEEGIAERGEDMAFFSDIRDLGYSINVDPSITLGHIGPYVYSGSLSSMMEEAPGKAGI